MGGFQYRLDPSVPDVNSFENRTIIDVFGNKDDDHNGNSTMSMLKTIFYHSHSTQMVYPSLSNGIVLITGASPWAVGALTEIIPAGFIPNDFDISEVIVEDVDTADKTYEIFLYAGDSDELVGCTRFASEANKGGVPKDMQTKIIPAGSRIRAALAIENGGSKSTKISLRYHHY